jgi:beta-lactamase class A
MKTSMMGLADDIHNAIADQPGVFGFYARNLGTDEVVEVDAERVLHAESAIKTCILVHYSRLVASGAVDPTTRVALTDELRFIGTGVLRYLANGLEPTLEDLAWLMIIVSDNTATAMLIQAVGGPAAVNATTAALGYPTARLNETITTVEEALAGEPFSTSSARDLAEVYTQLDERCRAMLFRQQHLIGLPRKLPHVSHAVDVGFEMPVRVLQDRQRRRDVHRLGALRDRRRGVGRRRHGRRTDRFREPARRCRPRALRSAR